VAVCNTSALYVTGALEAACVCERRASQHLPVCDRHFRARCCVCACRVCFEGAAMAAVEDVTAGDPFAALPHALACRILLLLSVQERARCAVVCPRWCATVADQSVWLRLDLSRADGAACSEATLHGAAARAGGQLQALRLACLGTLPAAEQIRLHGALCAVVAANAGTLRELLVDKPSGTFGLRLTELEALFAAAPQLRMLHACADCVGAEDARRLLRSEPPFAPLRVSDVSVHYLPADAVLALAADVVDCASLTSLRLFGVPLRAAGALDAVVDAALARRLTSVTLYDCGLTPAAAPAIARLTAGVSLTALDLSGSHLLDEATAVLLGNVLRANTSLTAFCFTHAALWRDAAAGAALVGLLTDHSSLRVLRLSQNFSQVDALVAAGAALAALLLANAPALQELDIRYCVLGDAGMRPVVEALRHNTHLTKLDCSGNRISEAFARHRLVPAVRANAGLRKLVVNINARFADAAREAEALVAARVRSS
jgi:hypothetical protein